MSTAVMFLLIIIFILIIENAVLKQRLKSYKAMIERYQEANAELVKTLRDVTDGKLIPLKFNNN